MRRPRWCARVVVSTLTSASQSANGSQWPLLMASTVSSALRPAFLLAWPTRTAMNRSRANRIKSRVSVYNDASGMVRVCTASAISA
jgi:hypothetical protein